MTTAISSETENQETVQFAHEEEVVDPIEVIYKGECPSLSGRSTLTYAIGRHSENRTLHLAITGNSGGGMFCHEWASASEIHDIVLGATEITAKCLAPIWAGKSVNTLSFGLAALRDVGLVEVNPDQTRQHRHVSGQTLETCVSKLAADQSTASPKRRKPKEG
jgi:hypothetical protein